MADLRRYYRPMRDVARDLFESIRSGGYARVEEFIAVGCNKLR